MSLAIASVTPTSAVATSGTITVSYPDGTSAGDFAAYGHTLWSRGLQYEFTQDKGEISVSFGASDITVTYKGSTSIPANSECTVHLNKRGQDNAEQYKLPSVKRMALAPTIRIDLGTPDTADSDGIAKSQSVSSAFTLDGAYASGGVATLDVPRNVVASWTTTAVLTITGEDEYGDVIVETTASGTSHTGKKAFKKITSITASTSITSATVGTGTVLGLPAYLEKIDQIIGQYEDNALVASPASRVLLSADSPALSSASQVYAVTPIPGEIKGVRAVTNTVVTTGDSTITVKTAGGTVGTITIAASGSAVGTVDTIDAIANAVVAAGGTIEFENDATPGAGAASFTVEFQPVSGTLVEGVQTTPTGTTGDARGTWDPETTPDGSTAYSLVVAMPDPNYKGVDNYDG